MPDVQRPLIPVSILDRANSRQGHTESEALRQTVDRARSAEALGYHRYWVAEHHGVPGIAGSAPAVLMAAIASRTSRIRIGSGGIMLPNHQPLVVAEQAATLQALFPGRIDLGVGRSVGFTPAVRTALRQGKEAADGFEQDLGELLGYLSGTAGITARPRDGSATPVFVLATVKGADIAARAGLAVVLGGPALAKSAQPGSRTVLERYRDNFRPSERYAEPHVIASVNVAVADSAAAARDLLLPEAWAMAHARTRGEFPPLEPAAALRNRSSTPRESGIIDTVLASSVHGTASDVGERLEELLALTGADELLVTGGAYDTAGQERSDALLAELMRLEPSTVPG